MDNNNLKHLDDLSQIRSIMEQSSRFISLSGLSGIIAGFLALFGAALAFWYFDYGVYTPELLDHMIDYRGYPLADFLLFLFADAGIVFILALTFAILLTTRKAKKQNQKVWTKPVQRMLLALIIPLVTGGIFCIILFYHGIIFLIAPVTLIFYGLALLNAAKYTLHDIKYLGVTEIILGLISSVIPGYGLLIWAIGFGFLHILYGVIMYYKYER